MENSIATFSKARLAKAVEAKWPGCPSDRWHIVLAEGLSEHLGRPVSTTQAKGWLSGVRPGSDMLIALAQVLGREREWFYQDSTNARLS